MPSTTPVDVFELVIVLLRHRITGKQIAATLRLSSATVSRVLRKARLSRLRDLDPPEPVRRSEREHPGELIHIDIKKPGRFDRVGPRITDHRPGSRTEQRRVRK